MSRRLRLDDATLDYTLQAEGDGYVIELDGRRIVVESVELDGAELRLRIDGQVHCISVARVGARWHVSDGRSYRFAEPASAAQAELPEAQGSIVSHMPGKVLRVLVEPGQAVGQGAPLVILEAMKMEHTLPAPAPGTVRAVPKAVGERVMPGDLLVELELDA